jgi:hypothetical protein
MSIAPRISEGLEKWNYLGNSITDRIADKCVGGGGVKNSIQSIDI